MTLRVLHVYSGNLYGGIETLLVTLARFRALAPGLVQDFALCFPGRLSAELAAASAPPKFLGEVRLRQLWSVARARRRLSALLSTDHFDAVIQHSVWTRAVFAGVAARAGVPEILWLHEPLRRHLLDRLSLFTRPQHVIFNSRYTRRSSARLPGVPASVVYCAVSPDPPAISAGQRQALRRELALPEQAPVVIQVSRMQSWKGHLQHLRALSALRHLPWSSLFVGGPQRPAEVAYFNALQREAAALGLGPRVRFLGERSDVGALLAIADIYFQPNQAPEPFGIAFIEALLASLPVVSTALGGPLEIITREVGRLVPAGNSDALARALEGLLCCPEERQELARAARPRALELCAPGARLAELEELVHKVSEAGLPQRNAGRTQVR